MKVNIYRNIHQSCYSIRVARLPVQHSSFVFAGPARLIVQQAGNEKAKLTGHKNVHAFVRAEWTDVETFDWNYDEEKEDDWSHWLDSLTGQTFRAFTYHPKNNKQFIDAQSEQEIFSAEAVWLTPFGAFYKENQ